MNLEEQLQHAKKEKRLTKTPILRRVILRSRWIAFIGGFGMAASVIRDISESSSLSSPAPLLVSLLNAFLAVIIIATSFRLKRASERHDYSTIRSALKVLHVIVALITLQNVGIILYLLAASAESGGLPFAGVLILALPLVILISWLSDIRKAREEVHQFLESGENSPGSTSREPI